MDNEIKVYKMNDYEWWASKWDEEATNEYYKKEYGLTEEDNPLEDIRECDVDKEGMWYLTEDERDIQELGYNDESVSCEIVNGMHKRKVQFGDLMRKDREVCKYISFREAVMKNPEFTEPYCIASTYW